MSAMAWMQWAATVVIGTISILIIVGNPLAGFLASRQGKSYSFLPFNGGICGTIALRLYPLPAVRDWWWVPLILDLSIPMTVYTFLIYMPWKRLEPLWRGTSRHDE